MNYRSLRTFDGPAVSAIGTIAACLLSVASAGAQAQAEKPLLAEQYFKNITALKGISVNQFMATMGFFSASLGENCTYCHIPESAGNWARYADDNETKQTARKMIVMVNALNKTYFGGKREVTCYSCHRGLDRPKVTPGIADVYGPTIPAEPDELVTDGPTSPTAEQILDKYLRALGGAERLASVKSYVAKGLFRGFSDPEKRPVEIYAKAPDQRTIIVHTAGGDSTTTFTGRAAWLAAPNMDSPMPVVELTGGDLDGARLEAQLSFPAGIKQTLKQWRAGYPSTIDDRKVQLVQGTVDGRYPVNLYFDDETGVLVRLVHFTDSPVGLSPTQIDYADYRDVSGTKMPFRWTTSWLDGRTTTELTEVQLNAAVDNARFGKPVPSTPPAKP
jgi:photosynthetic reaction center cytochrome c subunit